MVEKLVIENGRVTGVAVRFGKKREVIRARGGVVLSAGAFGSPQILMLSGIGPAAHLAEHGIAVALDKPTVGDDLQDHIDFVASWATESKGADRPIRGRVVADAEGDHRTPPGADRDHDHAVRRGRRILRTNPSLPAADIQYHFVPAMLKITAVPRCMATASRSTPACCAPKAGARCGWPVPIRRQRQ